MSYSNQVRFFDEHDDRTSGPPASRGYFRRGRGRPRGPNNRGGPRGNSRGRGFQRGGGHRRDAQSTISSKFRGRGDWRSRQRDRNDRFASGLVDDEDDISMGDGHDSSGKKAGLKVGFRQGSRGRVYSADQRQQWFRITIPHGSKTEKKFLFESINDMMDIPFNPINYHLVGNNAAFFVQGQQVADAVRACSRRITNNKGFRVEFYVSKSNPPITNLDEESIEKMKIAMSNRYTPEVKALDLSDFHNDETLNKDGIYPIMTRLTTMEAIANIIGEHIPEVECLLLSKNRLSDLKVLGEVVNKAPNVLKMDLSENNIQHDMELEKIKDMKLVELRLDKNPVCRKFKDETKYVTVVRKRFPKLLKLDGNDLPALISFAVEDTVELPPIQGSFFLTDAAKDLVLAFLEQYFVIFDSDDRQKLMDAYHEQATFSMSVFSFRSSLKQPYLGDYQDKSRNLKVLRDGNRHQKMLQYGRLSVVAQLDQLPKTQHDAATINVDITLATPSMMVFTVTGVFKETSGKHRATRAFSRIFITVPQGSGIVILNEQLTITNPSAELNAKSFKDPAPTPAPSPVMPNAGSSMGNQSPGELQQAMIKQFSEKSGMNADFSAKCLAQNDWDFDRSAKVFTELMTKNQIPPEAFVQNSSSS